MYWNDKTQNRKNKSLVVVRVKGRGGRLSTRDADCGCSVPEHEDTSDQVGIGIDSVEQGLKGTLLRPKVGCVHACATIGLRDTKVWRHCRAA